MFKRIGLFLIVNALVIVTISVIMNVLSMALGVKIEGYMGIAIFCGLFGMGGAFISLSISHWMAKRAYNIPLVDSSSRDQTAVYLYQTIARLSQSAGLPKVPEVGVYESPDPNAFATGPSKKKALVAFSSGLLNSMSREEFEAVAAHEISHIANGDMVTMTLLTGIANSLVMFLARMVAMAINTFLSDDDGEGLGFFGYILVVFVLESVFMALASIPIAAFSRWREYRADHGAAKLTSPGGMINALKRLREYTEIETQKDGFAISKISSGRKVSLWSTHPSIENRIERLQENF